MGNQFFLLVISLSISGALLGLLLFAIRPFTMKHFSKKWNYYIWLIVVVRLVLPFHLELNLIDSLFFSGEESPIDTMNLDMTEQKDSEYPIEPTKDFIAPPINETLPYSNMQEKTIITESNSYVPPLLSYAKLIWLFGIVLFFSIKVVDYRNFLSYIKANRNQITDLTALSIMDDIMTDLKIRRDIPLYENTLITSPMLVGIFRPFIVLPKEGLSYILHHELIHFKRRDLWYKWAVQFVWCIHWFNPLIPFIVKHLNIICELSCDEAIIAAFNETERNEYGHILIDTAEIRVKYRQNVISTTLIENKQHLKERLKNIMNHKKKTNLILVLSLLSIAVIGFTAALIGSKTINAAKSEDVKTVNSTDHSISSSFDNTIESFVNNLVSDITYNTINDVVGNISSSVNDAFQDNKTFTNSWNDINKNGKPYKLFDDDKAIAGKDNSDKWQARMWYGNGLKSLEANTFELNGSTSMAVLYANTDTTLNITSSFKLISGKFKIVQVKPDNTVTIINSTGTEATKTITIPKGRNAIKLIGQDSKTKTIKITTSGVNTRDYQKIFSNEEEENAFLCLDNIKAGKIDMDEIVDCVVYMKDKELTTCIIELLKQNSSLTVDDFGVLLVYSDTELTSRYIKQELEKGTLLHFTKNMLMECVPYFDEKDLTFFIDYFQKSNDPLSASEFSDLVPYIDENTIASYTLSWDNAQISFDILEELAPYMDQSDFGECILHFLKIGNKITHNQFDSIVSYVDSEYMRPITDKLVSQRMITKTQQYEFLEMYGE